MIENEISSNKGNVVKSYLAYINKIELFTLYSC